MYVRDHMRPELHKAFGVTPEEYDRKVIRLCSEITKQVFPFTIDLDNEKVWSCFAKLTEIAHATQAAKKQGGLSGRMKAAWLNARAAATFARLYVIPVRRHDLPQNVLLAPVW
jgi:magnesium-protoporphyrin IX monomethyl ester (oxidative) cyclase